MRFGDNSDDSEREPKPWWPSQWSVFTWNIVFLVFLCILVVNNPEPLNALMNLSLTWVVIFGGYMGWKFITRKYENYNTRMQLDAQRKEDEYHGLSPEEDRIWDDLKKKLNE